jgi:hypothetical protein
MIEPTVKMLFPTDWNIGTLGEFLLQMMHAHAKRNDDLDRAGVKAESAIEKRFDSVNEFRASLADQARLLMPRQEAESLLKSLTEKLETGLKVLADRVDTQSAQLISSAGKKSGIESGWGYAVGAVGLVLAIASFLALFFKKGQP